VIGKIMAHVTHEYDLDHVLILERNDAWASGIGDWFKLEFEELGGTVINRVK